MSSCWSSCNQDRPIEADSRASKSRCEIERELMKWSRVKGGPGRVEVEVGLTRVFLMGEGEESVEIKTRLLLIKLINSLLLLLLTVNRG